MYKRHMTNTEDSMDSFERIEIIPTCADFKVGDRVFHDRDPDGTLFSCGAGTVTYVDAERDTVGVEWNCMWIRSPSVRPYHLIKAAIK